MNTREEIRLKAEIEKGLRDLREIEYPWLGSLRRIAEIMDDMIEKDRRRLSSQQPAKAPKPRLPYSIK